MVNPRRSLGRRVSYVHFERIEVTTECRCSWRGQEWVLETRQEAAAGM